MVKPVKSLALHPPVHPPELHPDVVVGVLHPVVDGVLHPPDDQPLDVVVGLLHPPDDQPPNEEPPDQLHAYAGTESRVNVVSVPSPAITRHTKRFMMLLTSFWDFKRHDLFPEPER